MGQNKYQKMVVQRTTMYISKGSNLPHQLTSDDRAEKRKLTFRQSVYWWTLGVIPKDIENLQTTLAQPTAGRGSEPIQLSDDISGSSAAGCKSEGYITSRTKLCSQSKISDKEHLFKEAITAAKTKHSLKDLIHVRFLDVLPEKHKTPNIKIIYVKPAVGVNQIQIKESKELRSAFVCNNPSADSNCSSSQSELRSRTASDIIKQPTQSKRTMKENMYYWSVGVVPKRTKIPNAKLIQVRPAAVSNGEEHTYTSDSMIPLSHRGDYLLEQEGITAPVKRASQREASKTKPKVCYTTMSQNWQNKSNFKKYIHRYIVGVLPTRQVYTVKKTSKSSQ